jgi:Ca2+-binding EF-hand superfamily protein
MKPAMKRTGTMLLTGAALTLAVSGAAMARDGGHHGQYGQMRGGPVAFAELDANGDGQITEADITARAEARLSEADADGDGAVTLTELIDAGIARFEERYDARVAAAAPGEVPGRPSDAQVRARAEEMASRMLSRADADNSGTLEADEMTGGRGMARLFDRTDADGDGAITEEEFDTARAEMMERMRERGGERAGRDGHGPRGGEAPWHRDR